MLHIDLECTVGSHHLKAEIPTSAGTTVVVGPNGAGKSTLLKCILGEIRASRGRVTLGDRILFDCFHKLHTPTEKRQIGYVPQRYALFPHMSVLQNVAFGVKGTRLERHMHAMKILDGLEISAFAKRKATDLSGGQAQRVALARALAINPKALLLDEPLAALDAGARNSVRGFLRQTLKDENIPCLIVSHDVEDARALADSVSVLENGVIVQSGTLEEIQANPASEFVRDFLNVGAKPEGKTGVLGLVPPVTG